MKMKILIFIIVAAPIVSGSKYIFADEPGFVRTPSSLSGVQGKGVANLAALNKENGESDFRKPAIYRNRLERLKVKDASVETLIRTLSAETGRNVIIDGKVDGTVSVDLVDVSVDEAIQAIARATGNGAEMRPGYIIIRPIKESAQSKVIQLKNISGKSVQKGLENFLTDKGKLSYDSDSNSIMITDQPGTVADVASFIKEIDQTPKQVLVDAAILDIELKDDVKSGVDFIWNPSSRYYVGDKNFSVSPPTGTTPSGFFFRIAQHGITGLIDLLQSKTNTKLLARPRVMALNDKVAEMKVGGSQGYPQTVQLNTGATQEQIEFIETGVILKIVPHITEDRQIIMELNPQITDATLETPAGTTQVVPKTSTTEATATVRIKDGQTLILGGLIREKISDEDNQVPVLGDIPLIGILFKKKNRKVERREVIILVTPHIVDGEYEVGEVADMDRVKQDYKNLINTDYLGLKDKNVERNKRVDAVSN